MSEMGSPEQPTLRGHQEASGADPHREFIIGKLGGRRETIMQEFGPEEGNQRFETEVRFLTEMIRYLDTKPMQRLVGERDFKKDISARANAAGVHRVVNRGTRLYGQLYEERLKAQRAQPTGYIKIGYNKPEPREDYDSSHRRGDPEN